MIELNKCYCIDNLIFMNELPSNSIDLIYGDILFGTGKKFKDYQDLKPDKEIIKDFYIPRIKEMYRLLKINGSIYLQMDYRIVHWIRCILDDIFEYKNFRNEIIWQYKTGGASKNYFSRKHDDILWYSKSKDYTFNLTKEKSYVDKSKGYNPYTQQFTDDKGIYVLTNPIDVWNIPYINAHDKTNRVNYNSQKPLPLMDKIIKASSNKNDVVADFFTGSGGFLVKAKELGRKYIGCDINQNAVDITNNRILNNKVS